MIRNLVIAIILVFLCALSVFAKELPPLPLRQYLSNLPRMVGVCKIEKLSLPEMACAVFVDTENKLRIVALALDGNNISHIYALDEEGNPTMLWIRSDLTT